MDSGLQTLFTGRHVMNLETIHSTNRFLNEMLAQQRLPEGSAVVAREQTAGRGQAGSQWISEPGKNLLMSVVFYPDFLSIQNLFMLSKVFSLGLYDWLHDILKLDVKIKWPNDIYFQNKKLGGILIENSIQRASLNHTLLGVGLNINQEFFPAEIPNPVSLKMITGKTIPIVGCVNAICNALESRYLQLKANQLNQINVDYLKALYRFGEFHEYESDSKKFRAKISGIEEDGKIFLIHENGHSEKYDLKEVRFLR